LYAVVTDSPSSGMKPATERTRAGGTAFGSDGAGGGGGRAPSRVPGGAVGALIRPRSAALGNGMAGSGGRGSHGRRDGLDSTSPVRRSRQITSTVMIVST